MTRGITDNSVVYISIFSNSQLISVINNNNSVLIYERPAMMSTYTDETESIFMW